MTRTDQEVKARIDDLIAKQEDYTQLGWDDDIADVSLKIKELIWVLNSNKEDHDGIKE